MSMTAMTVGCGFVYLGMGVAMLIAFGTRDIRDAVLRNHVAACGRLPSSFVLSTIIAAVAIALIVIWPVQLKRAG